MQIRTRLGITDLHRRVIIVSPCRGRAMLAPTRSRQSRVFVTGHVFGASWLCNLLHMRIGDTGDGHAPLRTGGWPLGSAATTGLCGLSGFARGRRFCTRPVGVDDLIDPSRSAFVGASGFWIGWRLCKRVRACFPCQGPFFHISGGFLMSCSCQSGSGDSCTLIRNPFWQSPSSIVRIIS